MLLISPIRVHQVPWSSSSSDVPHLGQHQIGGCIIVAIELPARVRSHHDAGMREEGMSIWQRLWIRYVKNSSPQPVGSIENRNQVIRFSQQDSILQDAQRYCTCTVLHLLHEYSAHRCERDPLGLR